MISAHLKKNPRSEPLLQAVRDRIIGGEYPPGMMLSEKELCEEFSVSRTPFREAMRKLEELKLVNVLPRLGSYVAEVNYHEVKCAYEIRHQLEIFAARLATERCNRSHIERIDQLIRDAGSLNQQSDDALKLELDKGFHEIIRDAANNAILAETLTRLELICTRVWFSLMREAYSSREIVENLEHFKAAMLERDADALADLMASHMEKTYRLLKRQLSW